ncbi:MAG: PHP domain-containing protein [Planctomycetes bacterium]|nr:PHP domain-containing protein [Planctomycetota bacterium]
MQIDLHLHTNCSDGVYHPEKVLQKIIDAKYDIVSFTDHDSCAAYDILAKYPRPENLRIIKGVEMTTSHQDNEIHILGYFRHGCSEPLKTFLVAA